MLLTCQVEVTHTDLAEVARMAGENKELIYYKNKGTFSPSDFPSQTIVHLRGENHLAPWHESEQEERMMHILLMKNELNVLANPSKEE